jgi:hypothetical protein
VIRDLAELAYTPGPAAAFVVLFLALLLVGAAGFGYLLAGNIGAAAAVVLFAGILLGSIAWASSGG